MKIVAFTDSHGSVKALKAVKKKAKDNKADFIICGGDISIFSNQLNSLVKELAKSKIPILMLHGNHESAEEMRDACKPYPNIKFFHAKMIKLGDKQGIINFIGWGGGGFSEIDKKFEKFTKLIKKQVKKDERIVLVTHAPPYNTALDQVMGGSCGCRSIKNFIVKEKPILAVAGHIHECNNQKEVINKKSLVINPGPFGKILKI